MTDLVNMYLVVDPTQKLKAIDENMEPEFCPHCECVVVVQDFKQIMEDWPWTRFAYCS